MSAYNGKTPCGTIVDIPKSYLSDVVTILQSTTFWKTPTEATFEKFPEEIQQISAKKASPLDYYTTILGLEMISIVRFSLKGIKHDTTRIVSNPYVSIQKELNNVISNPRSGKLELTQLLQRWCLKAQKDSDWFQSWVDSYKKEDKNSWKTWFLYSIVGMNDERLRIIDAITLKKNMLNEQMNQINIMSQDKKTKWENISKICNSNAIEGLNCKKVLLEKSKAINLYVNNSQDVFREINSILENADKWLVGLNFKSAEEKIDELYLLLNRKLETLKNQLPPDFTPEERKLIDPIDNIITSAKSKWFEQYYKPLDNFISGNYLFGKLITYYDNFEKNYDTIMKLKDVEKLIQKAEKDKEDEVIQAFVNNMTSDSNAISIVNPPPSTPTSTSTPTIISQLKQINNIYLVRYHYKYIKSEIDKFLKFKELITPASEQYFYRYGTPHIDYTNIIEVIQKTDELQKFLKTAELNLEQFQPQYKLIDNVIIGFTKENSVFIKGQEEFKVQFKNTIKIFEDYQGYIKNYQDTYYQLKTYKNTPNQITTNDIQKVEELLQMNPFFPSYFKHYKEIISQSVAFLNTQEFENAKYNYNKFIVEIGIENILQHDWDNYTFKSKEDLFKQTGVNEIIGKKPASDINYVQIFNKIFRTFSLQLHPDKKSQKIIKGTADGKFLELITANINSCLIKQGKENDQNSSISFNNLEESNRELQRISDIIKKEEQTFKDEMRTLITWNDNALLITEKVNKNYRVVAELGKNANNQVKAFQKKYQETLSQLKKRQDETFTQLLNIIGTEQDNKGRWTEKFNKIKQFDPLMEKINMIPLVETNDPKRDTTKIFSSIKEIEALETEYENEFWKIYADIFQDIADAERIVVNNDKPFYVKMWDSVSGNAYANSMNELYILSGQKQGQEKDLVLKSVREKAFMTMLGTAGVTLIIFYFYHVLKRLYKIRKLRSKYRQVLTTKNQSTDDTLEDAKPRQMWISFVVHDAKTTKIMTPQMDTYNEIYLKTVDIIQKTLKPLDQLKLQPIKTKQDGKIIGYGVKTYLTRELAPLIEEMLIGELKRKKLTTHELAKYAIQKNIAGNGLKNIVELPLAVE
jgi:hypothetical protein